MIYDVARGMDSTMKNKIKNQTQKLRNAMYRMYNIIIK